MKIPLLNYNADRKEPNARNVEMAEYRDGHFVQPPTQAPKTCFGRVVKWISEHPLAIALGLAGLAIGFVSMPLFVIAAGTATSGLLTASSMVGGICGFLGFITGCAFETDTNLAQRKVHSA